MKDKHADQPTEKHARHYRIRVIPLLNRGGCKQLVFKNICTCKVFCAVLYRSRYVIKVLILWS
jgi:hypothetical protein